MPPSTRPWRVVPTNITKGTSQPSPLTRRMVFRRPSCCTFFFNDPATTEIYTLSLHDALPIYCTAGWRSRLHRQRSLVGQTSRSARVLQDPLFPQRRPAWTPAAGLESCPTFLFSKERHHGRHRVSSGRDCGGGCDSARCPERSGILAKREDRPLQHQRGFAGPLGPGPLLRRRSQRCG